MYPILTIVFIGVIALSLRLHFIKQKENAIQQNFWDREVKANSTPKNDITNLSYITIPLDKFPSECADSEEQKLLDSLKELSEKRILNLSGLTNTDLKEQYGPANLITMQEIGENFNKLTGLLVSLAERRIADGDYEGALKYLEYGAGLKSDYSKNYILLGSCYKELGKARKIPEIIELVKSLHLPLEHSILRSLNEDMGIADGTEMENFSTGDGESSSDSDEVVANNSEEESEEN